MANKSGILAGEAYVALDLDDEEYKVAMKLALQRLKQFGESSSLVVRATNRISRAFLRVASSARVVGRAMKGVVGSISKFSRLVFDTLAPSLFFLGASAAAMGASMLGAIRPAAKAFANLEDVVSRFRIVFGENAADAERWARSFAKSIGFADSTILDVMGRFQALFTTQGISGDLAATASKGLAELVPNLASFFEMRPDDVITRLFSGLVGEMEAVRRLGVDLSAQAVNLELENFGVDPKTATQGQKALARYNIIVRQTEVAQDDLRKTSNSLANTITRLSEAWKRTQEVLGAAVAPALTTIAELASKVLKRLEPLLKTKGFQRLATQFLVVGAGVTALGTAAVTIAPLVTAFGSLASFATAAAGAITTGLAASVTGLAVSLGTAVKLFGQLFKFVQGSKLANLDLGSVKGIAGAGGAILSGLFGGRGGGGGAGAGGSFTVPPAGPGPGTGLIVAGSQVANRDVTFAGRGLATAGFSASDDIIDAEFVKKGRFNTAKIGAGLRNIGKGIGVLSLAVIKAEVIWEGVTRTFRPATATISDGFAKVLTAGKHLAGTIGGVAVAFVKAGQLVGKGISRIITLLTEGDFEGVGRIILRSFNFIKSVSSAAFRELGNSFSNFFTAIGEAIGGLITSAQYLAAIVSNPLKFMDAISRQQGRVIGRTDSILEQRLADQFADGDASRVQVNQKQAVITDEEGNQQRFLIGASSKDPREQAILDFFRSERQSVLSDVKSQVAQEVAKEIAEETFGKGNFKPGDFKLAFEDTLKRIFSDEDVQRDANLLKQAIAAPAQRAAGRDIPGADPQSVEIQKMQAKVAGAAGRIAEAVQAGLRIAQTASITNSSARSQFGSGDREMTMLEKQQLAMLKVIANNTKEPGLQGANL